MLSLVPGNVTIKLQSPTTRVMARVKVKAVRAGPGNVPEVNLNFQMEANKSGVLIAATPRKHVRVMKTPLHPTLI